MHFVVKSDMYDKHITSTYEKSRSTKQIKIKMKKMFRRSKDKKDEK